MSVSDPPSSSMTVKVITYVPPEAYASFAVSVAVIGFTSGYESGPTPSL